MLQRMDVGIPREVKDHENRVAITPTGVNELVRRGHRVFIEHDAGTGSSHRDHAYVTAGATIVATADDLWGASTLILKVKEPLPEEHHRLRGDHVLFTYLHLAANAGCTNALIESKATAIAYETVELPNGALPLLAPMSEVAGRLAPHVGSYHLMSHSGGCGTLMGGVPGVPPAKMVIIGAGIAGQNAADIALGMRAEVWLLDRNVERLRQLDSMYRGQCRTIVSSAAAIGEALVDADLVVGSVLVAGAQAPKLVSNDQVSRMKPGSVLVDISVDQGGCFEDTTATTHSNPTYPVHNAIFYCVANMPGAVPRTSTHALTNATLPYAVALADHGWRAAMRRDKALARGLATHDGRLVSEPVAEALGLTARSAEEVLT